MLRSVSIAFATIGLLSVASAQNLDAIAARQDIYKGFGKATKPVGQMLQGDIPFDLAVVKTALATYSAGTKKLPALFPNDSKDGHDTAALPEIWTHKDDFEARLTKLGADADAALASITDEASFKTTMPTVLGECGACHKVYRAKK